MLNESKIKRAELHTHLGSSVHPAILWTIANSRGIKLPSKDYRDFEETITLTGKEKNKNIDALHNDFFYWTELIQSSPSAIEESVKGVIGGGYRKCNIVLQELRFNPMFRNQGGERDLDHIIAAALWGIEKATLEYPRVKAGVILMMDRTLSFKQNSIIVKKAIKYRDKGVIGIDLAGPYRKSFSIKKYAPLFKKARQAGLGLTIHTGEEGSLAEMRYVVDEIEPERIGHGILAAQDKKLMQELVAKNITLEICPTSNLRNSIVKDKAELKKIIKTFAKNKVKFTINTDGPEMYCSNITQEQEFLNNNGILKQRQIDQCTKWAFEASFID